MHVGKTSRRRPAQAQRAAVTYSQERPPSVAVFPISRNGPELDVFGPELDFIVGYTLVSYRLLSVLFLSSVFVAL